MINKYYGALIFIIILGCHNNNITKKTKADIKKEASKDRSLAPVTFILKHSSLLSQNKGNLHLLYHDSVAFGHPVVLSKDSTAIYINSPVFIQLGNKQIPYLVHPGERIEVTADKKNSLNLSIKGNDERNNELQFFRILIQKTGYIFPYNPFFDTISYHKKVASLSEMRTAEQAIASIKENRLNFLDSFSKHSQISQNFRKIAESCIAMGALQDSITVLFRNKNLLKQLNIFDQELSEKRKSIYKITFNPLFIYLKTYDMLANIGFSSFPEIDNLDSTWFEKKYAYVKDSFKGEIRNFLMARTIFSAITQKISVPTVYIKQFNNECTDTVYKAIIANKLDERKLFDFPLGSNNLIQGDGKTVDDIMTVIGRYKGKIILLDFWASWCGPCRSEMPFSAKLRDEYKGKDVVFIYISTDESKRNWLNANMEEGLNTKSSFLFANFTNASFKKQFQINTIPRYMLIGRDGRIINANAPRPSSPKLKELINKNLLKPN